MLESIINSNVWIKVTDKVGIKKKESKELALYVSIAILISLILIYYKHEEIKKFINTTCGMANGPIDFIKNAEDSFVASLTSSTSLPYKVRPPSGFATTISS
jgi:hypothetical protein